MKSRVAASHVSYSFSRYSSVSRPAASRTRCGLPVAALSILAMAMATAQPAQASTYYWDVNGSATTGFSTVVGTWNGTNAFFNSDSTGAALGTVTASIGSGDDLVIPQATTNTGSLTVSGAQNASSITFAANVGPTTTITGGSLTIGGTGTSSGVFQQSTGANIVNTALALNSAVSAFSFSNSGTGLLTIGGNVTGAASSGTQTITSGSSNSGGITFSNVIADGPGGITALTVNSSNATAVTTLNGANTYTGATTITAGKLTVGGTGRLSSSSSVAVNSTVAGALTINSGGIVGGNVTVAPSSGAAVANLVNNGAISGNLTISSSASPAPIAVQANAVISGNANLGSGSSTGNVKNDGQLTVSGASAATVGTISSTGTGSGASAGTGAIYITNSGGSALNFANGSSFSWLSLGNGASANLNSAGTTSLYGYGQGQSSTTATPYTININSGTWNVGQVGQNNSGKVSSGTTNILGGSVFNLASIGNNTWNGISTGASNGGGFMHGIWNIGGASAGTMNITGGFNVSGGSGIVPTGSAINGLQFTVGNGGNLTTTAASTLGFVVLQNAGQTTAQTTNSLTVNAGSNVTTSGSFTIANNTNAQTAITTNNSLVVNGGTFSNSGGILYIGNNNLANTFTETNSITVAGGTLNQAGGAVSLGNSGTAATNYANSLNISSGAMNVGTAASNQALQVGTSSNAASNTVTNTVNLSGGRLVVSGLVSAFTGGNQTNTFNWTGGQLTAGTLTTSATFATPAGGGISSGLLNNTGGTFAPGDIGTGGKTILNGAYTQGSSGTLAIDLGSNTIATAFQSGVAFYDTIAMTGALTLGGKLNVSAINSYIPSGTFNIITGATSNSGTFTNVNPDNNRVNLLTGGSMIFTRGATSTLTGYTAGSNLVWTGNASVSNGWDTGTANWSRDGVASSFSNANADYVTFDQSGIANNTVNLNSTVTPSSVIFSNTSGTYTVTGSGKISGSSTVTMQGAGGTVSLDTANDYSGATSVTAGIVKLGNATALGTTAAGTSISSGAVLDLNGQSVGAEALALNGTGISNGGALINSSSSAGTYAGNVTISPGTSIGGTGNFTLSGGLAATAATNNLIKSGTGTVTLSASAGSNRSTVNATTQIDGGVLRIQNASALATGTTAVTTINGGTLELNGGITLDQPISANNGATLRSDGTNSSNGKISVSTAVGANAVTLSTVNSGDVFNVGNGANDITGGNGSDDTITVSGPGTVVLGSASDYVGNWSFNGGTTQIGSVAALGATPASTITLNGGALNGRLAGSTVFTANPITVSSNSSLNADRSSNGAGVNYTFGALSIGSQTLSTTSTAAVTSGTGGVIVGATTLTGNPTFNVTNGATANTTLTLGGIVSGPTFGITKIGSGTLSLTGLNTFSGGVTVNSGTLNVGGTATNTGSTVTGSATGSGNVTFATGTTLSSSSAATWFTPRITLAGAGSTFNIAGGNRLAISFSTLDLNDASRTGLTTVNVNSKSLAVTGGNTLASESTGLWSWEVATTLATPVIQDGTLDLQTTAFSGANFGGFFLRSTSFNNADLIVGPNVILLGSGTSAFGGSLATSPNVTVDGIVTMNGTSKNMKSLAGSGSVFNSMTVANSSNSTLNLLGTTGSTNFSGLLADGPGTGTLALSKTGNSTQILSGANTYSGNTTVSGGTLLARNPTGSATGSGQVFVTSGATLGGNGSVSGATTLTGATIGSSGEALSLGSTLSTNGSSSLASGSTVSVTGGTTVSSGSFTVDGTLNGGVSVGTNTLNGSGTVNGTTTVNGGTIGGTLSLTTLVATGNSTIASTVNASSGTTVSSGTLTVAGTLGGGAVSIESGATLKGAGTVNGATTIQSGGFLSPGNSPDLLTFGDTLVLAGTTTMEISGLGTDRGINNANGFDAINVANQLTWGGTLDIVAIGGFNFDQVGSYNLFAFGSQTGGFASGAISVGGTALTAYDSITHVWSANNMANSFTYAFDLDNGTLAVTTAIPEPSTFAALAGLGAIGLALYRRRRSVRRAA